MMSTAEAWAKAAAKQRQTLNTVLDSEGREVVVEERQDAEAQTKFQETVDLLVAAGKQRLGPSKMLLNSIHPVIHLHPSRLITTRLSPLVRRFPFSSPQGISALVSRVCRHSTRSWAV